MGQVVNTYIEAIRRNDAAAIPLHPEMIGEFPTNTYRGAAAFREGVELAILLIGVIDGFTRISPRPQPDPNRRSGSAQ